jgi:hypothetical protein
MKKVKRCRNPKKYEMFIDGKFNSNFPLRYNFYVGYSDHTPDKIFNRKKEKVKNE